RRHQLRHRARSSRRHPPADGARASGRRGGVGGQGPRAANGRGWRTPPLERRSGGRRSARRTELEHSGCTMRAVLRRPRRAANEAEETPVDGTVEAPATEPLPRTNGHSEPPSEDSIDLIQAPQELALATTHPRLDPDPGLYAVLGLDPSASDV